MKNGIVAGTLPAGLKYGAAIQAAADANSFSAELLYAIGWIETISVEEWIEATWPGKTAATVVTGNGADDPYGYGMFQETPQTSGNTLPENWEDPQIAATFAITHHLVGAWAIWAAMGFSQTALVRCIAAEYNAGRQGALNGHAEGDVGKYTTFSEGVSYPDRVRGVYNALAVGKVPAGSA